MAKRIGKGTRRPASRILAGLSDALAHAKGDSAAARVHAPKKVDVRRIRLSHGLSQEAFAARFGFAASAVRDWEQGRREPGRAARLFLTVIAREPEAVFRALGRAQSKAA
ncbi:MAG TPA: helix-turn-helix domain-containing protein [Micropepsaceae bacterium]|nr:helix-turn-helix domain-containing protein [Micropepsaceae bacterium]HRK71642.1 helix-turn-helix domain-containing protein [Micropepsaceae bacterium]